MSGPRSRSLIVQYQDLLRRIHPSPSSTCRLWTGGRSRGHRRETDYPAGRFLGKVIRVHRWILLLHSIPVGVDHPDFLRWYHWAITYYTEYEASHTCDVSLCCHPDHLVWERHVDNVINQARRRRSGQEQTDTDVSAA